MVKNDVQLGEGVVIYHPDLVNLYGCKVGAGTKIGTFVEIQKGANIGARCKVSQPHLHLRRREYRGWRFRWTWCDVHQ